MITSIIPKLPMRNKAATREFYVQKLGFEDAGSQDYEFYLIVKKGKAELHFFEHATLNPGENYGQVYIRTDAIDELYQAMRGANVPIHPNGSLQVKPWGQKEFSLLDPDNNLLTFGQSI